MRQYASPSICSKAAARSSMCFNHKRKSSTSEPQSMIANVESGIGLVFTLLTLGFGLYPALERKLKSKAFKGN